MIDVQLDGTVEASARHRDSGQDGRADYAVENILSVEVSITARKEFPHGYVNLEGYVLSRHWTTERDLIHAFEVDQNEALEDFEIDPATADLSVEIGGDGWSWVEQAVRYVTERPNKSVLDALQQFKSWDETNGRELDKAIARSEDKPYTDEPAGGLTQREWNEMVSHLASGASSGTNNTDINQFRHDEDGGDDGTEPIIR